MSTKHPLLKIGTVTLVVREGPGEIELLDSLSSDEEIDALDEALQKGVKDPLGLVYRMRALESQENEEFADYIEGLLSQPFVRPEIKEHGLKWFRSKMRIEQFHRSEREATEVIAQFAFQVFQHAPDRRDFMLAGPNAQVRVRIVSLQLAVSRIA